MIRKLNRNDIETIASVHLVSFPGFFLSSLGTRFLSLFYSGICTAPEGIAFVYLNDANIPVGFVAGTANPGGFYSRLLKQNWLKICGSLNSTCLKQTIYNRTSLSSRLSSI